MSKFPATEYYEAPEAHYNGLTKPNQMEHKLQIKNICSTMIVHFVFTDPATKQVLRHAFPSGRADVPLSDPMPNEHVTDISHVLSYFKGGELESLFHFIEVDEKTNLTDLFKKVYNEFEEKYPLEFLPGCVIFGLAAIPGYTMLENGGAASSFVKSPLFMSADHYLSFMSTVYLEYQHLVASPHPLIVVPPPSLKQNVTSLGLMKITNWKQGNFRYMCVSPLHEDVSYVKHLLNAETMDKLRNPNRNVKNPLKCFNSTGDQSNICKILEAHKVAIPPSLHTFTYVATKHVDKQTTSTVIWSADVCLDNTEIVIMGFYSSPVAGSQSHGINTPGVALIFQKNGVVFAVSTNNISQNEMPCLSSICFGFDQEITKRNFSVYMVIDHHRVTFHIQSQGSTNVGELTLPLSLGSTLYLSQREFFILGVCQQRQDPDVYITQLVTHSEISYFEDFMASHASAPISPSSVGTNTGAIYIGNTRGKYGCNVYIKKSFAHKWETKSQFGLAEEHMIKSPSIQRYTQKHETVRSIAYESTLTTKSSNLMGMQPEISVSASLLSKIHQCVSSDIGGPHDNFSAWELKRETSEGIHYVVPSCYQDISMNSSREFAKIIASPILEMKNGISGVTYCVNFVKVCGNKRIRVSYGLLILGIAITTPEGMCVCVISVNLANSDCVKLAQMVFPGTHMPTLFCTIEGKDLLIYVAANGSSLQNAIPLAGNPSVIIKDFYGIITGTSIGNVYSIGHFYIYEKDNCVPQICPIIKGKSISLQHIMSCGDNWVVHACCATKDDNIPSNCGYYSYCYGSFGSHIGYKGWV